ncbi:MAG TPA: aldehyde dehydrogenase family protein, partial [Chryseosolibacter sp.]
MKNFGIKEALSTLGVSRNNPGVSTGTARLRSKGARIDSISPVDGKVTGSVQAADERSYAAVADIATEAFKAWRDWP